MRGVCAICQGPSTTKKSGPAPLSCPQCALAGRKMCTKCREILPTDRFDTSKQARSGLESWCKECGLAARRKQAGTRRADGLNYRSGRQHGLTDGEYLALRRCKACDACGSTDPGAAFGFTIDHDHSCCPGKYGCQECVRGLLCNPCNLAAGFLQDDPALAMALASYLSSGARPYAQHPPNRVVDAP